MSIWIHIDRFGRLTPCSDFKERKRHLRYHLGLKTELQLLKCLKFKVNWVILGLYFPVIFSPCVDVYLFSVWDMQTYLKHHRRLLKTWLCSLCVDSSCAWSSVTPWLVDSDSLAAPPAFVLSKSSSPNTAHKLRHWILPHEAVWNLLLLCKRSENPSSCSWSGSVRVRLCMVQILCSCFIFCLWGLKLQTSW